MAHTLSFIWPDRSSMPSAAASIACAISRALANVKLRSVNSLCCMRLLLMPHTYLSLNISSRLSLCSQGPGIWFSSLPIWIFLTKTNPTIDWLPCLYSASTQAKQRTRIKLYNTLVRSVLLYNCGTWALTKTDEEKLDSFHRKQLRRVLGIRYPTKISNKSLYKKCDQTPISLEV